MLEDRLIAAGVPYAVIGEVGGTRLTIEDKIDISLAEAAQIYENALMEQVTAH